MKILFVAPKPFKGGAEKITALIANHMAEKRHNVKFACLCDKKITWQLQVDAKIEKECLGNGIQGIARLIHEIITGNYDVVFSSFLDLNLIVLATKPFSPKTRFIIRDALSIEFSHKLTSLPILTKLLTKWLYRFADAQIAQTADMSNANTKLLGENIKRTVIPNPIGMKISFQEKPTQPQPKKFLSIGRLSAQKGFIQLIPAFIEAHKVWLNIELDIVGDGEDRDILQKMLDGAEANSFIHIHPRQENIMRFYEKADVYILPSEYEGFCNTALEALAHGIPIIASAKDTGIAHLVTHMKHGILLPDNSPVTLEKGIHQMMRNFSLFSRQEIFQSIHDRFETDIILHEYEKIFELQTRAKGT